MSRKRSKTSPAATSPPATSPAAARSADADNAASNGAAKVAAGCVTPHRPKPGRRYSWSDATGSAGRRARSPAIRGPPADVPYGRYALVALWALTGPWFGYSDSWQLVINTSTTIVTFLMVFLIQNTQNRDSEALHLKLAELIIAARQAENQVATIEDLSEEELEELHEQYRIRAESALDQLNRRRGELKKAS